ncbi:uncharacterized protein LOC117537340 [Gymnodraco acuticeps]|uniref:Uncharacterized protein LOC117537340 n=1 Tax=Gymnodraco acuticeps TaxID=8218 RepID=A0A6P8T4A4_GYMAC|nr:uncharacterized protein LOC117537340 [Gymnodraco acuticeps]
MDKKGPNFTSAETHALLLGVRNNYDSIVGSFNREGGATKVKSGIWMEVTDNVNATGSGHKRTVDQVRLRWKNLKQQATKDHSQATNHIKGDNTQIWYLISLVVSSHNLYMEYQTLYWMVVNAPDVTHTIEDEVLLTHVDPEAGPSARPDDTLQEPPLKRKCKRTRKPEQRDDAYETLLSRETERAEMQIRLAEEQIQLCRLQQTETSLRIQLLKARL